MSAASAVSVSLSRGTSGPQVFEVGKPKKVRSSTMLSLLTKLFPSALAVVACCLATTAEARAFDIHNQSRTTYRVALCAYDPGSSGMLSDGTSWEAPTDACWRITGWII